MEDLQLTGRIRINAPDRDGDIQIEIEIESSDRDVSAYVDKKDIPKLIEYLQSCI